MKLAGILNVRQKRAPKVLSSEKAQIRMQPSCGRAKAEDNREKKGKQKHGPARKARTSSGVLERIFTKRRWGEKFAKDETQKGGKETCY